MPNKPLVAELIELLALERLEENLFRGQSRDIGSKAVFGGQVLGQALSAAQATVDPDSRRRAHSLHAYFLRAGDVQAPIIYDVDRTRDGGSFSVRRVSAIQHGKVIFFCAASFQGDEDGVEHQAQMPEVPAPEDIAEPPPVPPEVMATLPVKMQRWLSRELPFEFRYVQPRNELNPQPLPPRERFWFRLTEKSAIRRNCTAPCWPMPRTTSCWARPISRTASATTSRTCRWPRSTTRCGSTARFAPTTGCCMPSTVPPPRIRAAWPAA